LSTEHTFVLLIDSLLLFASHSPLAGHFMTQQPTPVRGREIIERWCALAESRLDYLTELFESGRWRRFHTEADFLDNIREAKAAVETWRGLATAEASLDNRGVNYWWLDRPNGVPAYGGSVLHEEPRRAMRPSDIRTAPVPTLVPSPPLQPEPILAAPKPADREALLASPFPAVRQKTTADEDWQRALDPLVLHERYPILRSAM
jgi:uncharacterized repeat protein (TIGR03809 family)